MTSPTALSLGFDPSLPAREPLRRDEVELAFATWVLVG